MGPRTGRSAGYCVGNDAPGNVSAGGGGRGLGRGQGMGRGMGRAMGRGMGRGIGRFQNTQVPNAAASNDQQINALQTMTERLEATMNGILEQLKAMKNQD